jgi:hypothetical protein
MVTWDEAIRISTKSKRLAPNTKQDHRDTVYRCMTFHGIKPTDEFSKDPAVHLKLMETQFGYFHEKCKMRPKTISGIYSTLRRLQQKNKVVIEDEDREEFEDNYIVIDRRTAATSKENRGWRNSPEYPEIWAMTTSGFASPRELAMIYTDASSGLREGALAHATFGHLEQVVIDGIPQPNYWIGPIYSKTRLVLSCCSRQAFHQINAYKEFREKVIGETIYDKRVREDQGERVEDMIEQGTKVSPLFREHIGDRSSEEKRKNPEFVDEQDIYRNLARIARLSRYNGESIRKLTPTSKRNKGFVSPIAPHYNRYVSSAVHGFKGFFETAVDNYVKNQTHKHILLGWDIQTHKFYFDREESLKELFQSYKLAEPKLIILSPLEMQQQAEIQELRVTNTAITDLTKRVERMESRNQKGTFEQLHKSGDIKFGDFREET